MIRIEIDFLNRKQIQKLQGENTILKQQLANYRNEVNEWNRRFRNEPTKFAATNKEQ